HDWRCVGQRDADAAAGVTERKEDSVLDGRGYYVRAERLIDERARRGCPGGAEWSPVDRPRDDQWYARGARGRRLEGDGGSPGDGGRRCRGDGEVGRLGPEQRRDAGPCVGDPGCAGTRTDAAARREGVEQGRLSGAGCAT